MKSITDKTILIIFSLFFGCLAISPLFDVFAADFEKRKQTVDPVLEAKFLLVERGKIPIGECVDQAEDLAQKIIDEMESVDENLEEKISAGNGLIWLPEECKCENCSNHCDCEYDDEGKCTSCDCTPCSGNVCPFDKIKKQIDAIIETDNKTIELGQRIKDLIEAENLEQYDPDRWEILNKLRNSRYKMEECVRGFESALKHPRTEINFLSCRTAIHEINKDSGGLVLLEYFENHISDFPYCYPYTANSAIRKICKNGVSSDDCHIPLKGCMDNYFCAGFVGPTGDLGGNKEGDEPQVEEGEMPICSSLYSPPNTPPNPPSSMPYCIDPEESGTFDPECSQLKTGLENYRLIKPNFYVDPDSYHAQVLLQIDPKGPNGEGICMCADTCGNHSRFKYVVVDSENRIFDVYAPKDYSGGADELALTFDTKPVIYLYPEKETKIKVKIKPKGKMIESIPVYGNGWDVTVEPNGLIDKKFDYLFYETAIPSYQIEQPIEGFLIEFNKLEKFFDEILPQLGLQGKEIKEFKEWWLNKLEPSQYYLIKLLERDVIDEIEAMEIDPKPDTVIRIRFLFFPFDDKIKTIPPEIVAPLKRQGFTVVEWGRFNL